MKYLTKGKIVLYLAAIFVAGGVTGAVFGWRETRPKEWGRQTETKMCDYFRKRLQEELGLNADQIQQLEPLLQKRVKAMEEVHARTVQQIDELLRSSDAEIADALKLTAEQRAKLQEMGRNRREHFGKGRKGGPPPPPSQSQ
jgi:Spy/CpxP family protein refolding chaperone